MYIIYYHSAINPDVIHETYAVTYEEALKIVQHFRDSKVCAWVKGYNY